MNSNKPKNYVLVNQSFANKCANLFWEFSFLVFSRAQKLAQGTDPRPGSALFLAPTPGPWKTKSPRYGPHLLVTIDLPLNCFGGGPLVQRILIFGVFALHHARRSQPIHGSKFPKHFIHPTYCCKGMLGILSKFLQRPSRMPIDHVLHPGPY